MTIVEMEPFRLEDLAVAAWGADATRWPDGLMVALRGCAAASLEREEGEYLRCAVALQPEWRPDSAQLLLMGFASFAQSQPVTVASLVKLGAGTTPTASCLVVAPDRRETDKLHLTGIARYPPPWFDTSGFTWIEIVGPGRLRVRGRESRLLDHSPGRVRVELELKALADRVPSAIAEGVAATFCRSGHDGNVRIGGRPFRLRPGLPHCASVSPLRDAIVKVAPGYIAHALGEVASEIERAGHGGTVLIASRAAIAAASGLLEGGVEFGKEARESPGSGWTAPLVAAAVCAAAANLERDGNGIFEDVGLKELNEHERVVLRVWDLRRLGLAALATADGVLVLDESLHPVAYKRSVTGVGSAPFPEGAEAFLKGRGQRHRSTAHAVQALGEQALGMAVSHDGGYTIFTCAPRLVHVTRWGAA